MRTALVTISLVFLAPSIAYSEKDVVDLRVAMYPYVPDAESGVEKLELAFEEYAKSKEARIDLDLVLVNTYDEGIGEVDAYDVAEMDLCMFDKLRKNGSLRLDPIPSDVTAGTSWIGPAVAAMQRPMSKYIVPHWVCGNFFVHWSIDGELSEAKTFNEIRKALHPDKGRFLFADIWGGGTLGEFYADAVLDRYGAEEARKHLIQVATARQDDVKTMLRADAAMAVYQLTMKLKPVHRRSRDPLHYLTFVYPRAFAVEFDSALIGYSERLHYVERRIQEEPWKSRKLPVGADQLSVRQFPFGEHSKGTPTWVDAFIIPKGKLARKKKAIKLFLVYMLSDDGYRDLLEPRDYFPAAYLLPAASNAYNSEFVRKQMPILKKYRSSIDSSLPMIEHDLYLGVDRAGEAMRELLQEAQ